VTVNRPKLQFHGQWPRGREFKSQPRHLRRGENTREEGLQARAVVQHPSDLSPNAGHVPSGFCVLERTIASLRARPHVTRRRKAFQSMHVSSFARRKGLSVHLKFLQKGHKKRFCKICRSDSYFALSGARFSSGARRFLHRRILPTSVRHPVRDPEVLLSTSPLKCDAAPHRGASRKWKTGSAASRGGKRR
jgi:hypothetical protein